MWALIGADNQWLAGPLDEEPEPGEGERVVIVALGYPERVQWDPASGGFVDVAPPTPPRRLAKLEFLLRLTPEECVMLFTLDDSQVIYIRELYRAAADIDVTHPLFVALVTNAEVQGLIGVGRAAAILAPPD